MLKDVMEMELANLELTCDEEAARLLEELSSSCGDKCLGVFAG